MSTGHRLLRAALFCTQFSEIPVVGGHETWERAPQRQALTPVAVHMVPAPHQPAPHTHPVDLDQKTELQAKMAKNTLSREQSGQYRHASAKQAPQSHAAGPGWVRWVPAAHPVRPQLDFVLCRMAMPEPRPRSTPMRVLSARDRQASGDPAIISHALVDGMGRMDPAARPACPQRRPLSVPPGHGGGTATQAEQGAKWRSD